MNPTEQGWKQENDQLIPIMTQNNAAPEKLLKITDCNCSGEMQILSMQLQTLWTPLHCCMWLVLGTGTRVPVSIPVTRVPVRYPGTRVSLNTRVIFSQS